ncbi:MAG: vWA domain-containing protein [Fuerstiella sp.]
MKRLDLIGSISGLRQRCRKGIFFVLAIVSLMAAMTFVGMSVDLGMITVTQTRMQSSADAAALAAAQEIVVGIREAGEQGETNVQAVQAIAAAAARTMAKNICEMNGFYIAPSTDVELGHRLLAEDGVSFTETWGSAPYNMVKVSIRKTNSDSTKPDAKLPLIFAPVTGTRAHALQTSAVAFIESRDIVAVLDYSGSMAFDSQFRTDTKNRIGLAAIETGLDNIWDALVDSGATYSDEQTTEKFPSTGFGDIDSYAGTYISSSDTQTIFEALHLDDGGPGSGSGSSSSSGNYYDGWSSGSMSYGGYRIGSGYGYNWLVFTSGSYNGYLFRNSGGSTYYYYGLTADYPGAGSSSSGGSSSGSYVPFPQEGKNSSGMRKGKPSESESKSLWEGYINYVKGNSLSSFGYQKKYGYRTLMHYLTVSRLSNRDSEDLWRAPIYPHHAMKEGVTKLATFLDNLGYGDQLGLVTYATNSRIETGLWDDGADETVDLAGKHLTTDVMKINTIQRHKQPGHYNSSTGIGYGLEDAKELLDDQGRYGAQKAVLLMTDGQSNQYPSGYSSSNLPSGWNWNEITDFDGDGTADVIIDSGYTSGGNSDGNWRAALHSFVRAKEAFDAGYVVHTISMGDGADTVLMSAIAQMSGGEYVHIPSGASNEEMEADLEAAFAVLAGQVPPARLLIDDE